MYHVNRFKDGKFIKVVGSYEAIELAEGQAYILNCQYCYNIGIEFTVSKT